MKKEIIIGTDILTNNLGMGQVPNLFSLIPIHYNIKKHQLLLSWYRFLFNFIFMQIDFNGIKLFCNVFGMIIDT